MAKSIYSKKVTNNPEFNIVRIANDIKKHYPSFNVSRVNGILLIRFLVKPTNVSVSYNIEISFDGKSRPKVFVKEPDIVSTILNKAKVHMYGDGSLCLYYNLQWTEFNYQTDVFSNTIIPWISLWLFYYEIWLFTDEWIGGGYHNGEKTT